MPVISRRVVDQRGERAKPRPQRAERGLSAIAALAFKSTPNQVALSKAGGKAALRLETAFGAFAWASSASRDLIRSSNAAVTSEEFGPPLAALPFPQRIFPN